MFTTKTISERSERRTAHNDHTKGEGSMKKKMEEVSSLKTRLSWVNPETIGSFLEVRQQDELLKVTL